MIDYPYPTSFIEPMPAWPVNASCNDALEQKLIHEDSEYSNLYAIAAAGKVYYNSQDQLDCLDTGVE
jgi:lysosomal Pro-X carboxypeptidase